jgi:hypothetical protein
MFDVRAQLQYCTHEICTHSAENEIYLSEICTHETIVAMRNIVQTEMDTSSIASTIASTVVEGTSFAKDVCITGHGGGSREVLYPLVSCSREQVSRATIQGDTDHQGAMPSGP